MIAGSRSVDPELGKKSQAGNRNLCPHARRSHHTRRGKPRTLVQVFPSRVCIPEPRETCRGASCRVRKLTGWLGQSAWHTKCCPGHPRDGGGHGFGRSTGVRGGWGPGPLCAALRHEDTCRRTGGSEVGLRWVKTWVAKAFPVDEPSHPSPRRWPVNQRFLTPSLPSGTAVVHAALRHPEIMKTESGWGMLGYALCLGTRPCLCGASSPKSGLRLVVATHPRWSPPLRRGVRWVDC